jgi:hypothetical protein
MLMWVLVSTQRSTSMALQNSPAYHLYEDSMESQKVPMLQRYDPDQLLASLIGKLNLKNDAALSRALEVSPPVISKIRHRRLPVTASLLIRMHEISRLSIAELRNLMGDRRGKFRISDKHFKPKTEPS